MYNMHDSLSILYSILFYRITPWKVIGAPEMNLQQFVTLSQVGPDKEK